MGEESLDEETEPAVTILSRDMEPDEKGLGRAVVGVLSRVRESGWEHVRLYSSLVWVADAFYTADSSRKPGQEAPEHRRGDLKKAAHQVQHWWLEGVHPPVRVGFKAHWIEGVTPKGGRSFQFQEAMCADPIGMPTEIFTDFTPGAQELRQKKNESQEGHRMRVEHIRAIARERDERYNLGQSWLDKRPTFKAFKEFDKWLGEAIEITKRGRAGG